MLDMDLIIRPKLLFEYKPIKYFIDYPSHKNCDSYSINNMHHPKVEIAGTAWVFSPKKIHRHKCRKQKRVPVLSGLFLQYD